ncbi:hypothetical protein [Streptomyces sp. NPDC046197]|uniref:hypothetical protein n=1 Tax=Streptomyces sp. NPDC046197 TaxID=3154337 RepID=UPI0033F3AAAA
MTNPGFRPSHVVPPHGMPAWESPDPSRPTASLDAFLPVELADRRGEWARVVCANGWSAWVDGRRLVAVPQDPPAADGPVAATTDPRPLIARAEQALAGYRSAVEELAAGGLDGESFRNRTRGLRIGVVLDGESMWLYDPERGQWVYTDGTRLTTYTVDGAPDADEARPSGATGSLDPRSTGAVEPNRPGAVGAAGSAAVEPGGPEGARVADRGHDATRAITGSGEP